MSGKDETETRWAPLVVIECGVDLLNHIGSVARWNDLLWGLVRRRMVPVAWAKGSRPPPPIGVFFDFRGLCGANRDWTGIDLTFCETDGAAFDGADLSGAKLWSCPGATFRGSRLAGSEFRGDISGCRFDGAVGDADFSRACYAADDPPTGLPAEALAACEVIHPSDKAPKGMPEAPEEIVLKVRATITEVPW